MGFDMANSKPVGKPFDLAASKPVDNDGFTGDSIIEPIMAVGSGIATTAAGGLAGIAQTLNPFAVEGAGADMAKSVQEMAFQPKTEGGKEGLATLGDLVKKGVDLANIPISGIAGLMELVSGQGLDQAVETLKNTQKSGAGVTAGERVFEETGSPLAATMATIAPDALASATGFSVAPKISSAVRGGAESVVAGSVPAVQQIGKELFNLQTPTKQRIARMLEEGSTDVETAQFKLLSPEGVPANPTRLQEFLNVGGPKVKTDNIAKETIKQGFNEGIIAAVKGSSRADKLKLEKMVEVMQRGKANSLYAAKNRPSDIAGDTLLQRVQVIRTANRQAGADIDLASIDLKGSSLDILGPVTKFGESLDSLGVVLIPNGSGGFRPDFKESQLSPGDRGPISEVIRQMNIRGQGEIDAFNVHKMKRIIDNNVTYGRVKTGMSGDAERALKSFRSDLDGALDSNFPAYNAANTKYSETISALNSIQDVAGRKMDLSGGNADKALGTLLRRTLSNEQSRIRLVDSIDEIEAAAKNYGGTAANAIDGPSLGKEDLLTQVLFVDELDAVFGPVARTSFQGQIDQALKQGVNAATTQAGAIDAGVSVAGKLAEKARGINQEAAFKSIKALLKDSR